MNSELVFDDGERIKKLIYEIRGKQVMLDSDLARLYECKNGTKTINLAVRRHKDRFPEDFCFQLNEEELEILRSQVGASKVDLRFQIETANNKLRSQDVTAKWDKSRNMSRNRPYVFTEQGVAMLATILRTDVASRVSIAIMRAFVSMKQYISSSLIEQKYINDLVIRNDKRLGLVEKVLANFKEKNNHLFFEGQIYDAHSLLRDILAKSEKEVIIIDNYVDKSLLDILSKTNKKVVVITNKYNNDDYNKYRKQYSNVELRIRNDIHDRFIIVDRRILYHCGASFKDLGNKCFAINKMEDWDYLEQLITLLGLTK